MYGKIHLNIIQGIPVKKVLPILIVLTLLMASSFFIWLSVRKADAPKEDTSLIVGTNAEYYPFSFIDNDAIAGFDIDIIKEVARRLGKDIEFKDMPFDALLPKIQFGAIQVIAAGITATPEKAKKVLFTKPHLTGDPLIVISLAKNPAITGLTDLDEKEVVVNEGYTADLYMSTISGPKIKRLATPAEAFLALNSGNAYAFVAAKSSVQPYFDKYGVKEFNIFTLDGVQDNYSFAISKKYPDLLSSIQKELDEMEQDGTIAALAQKWKLS